MLGITLAVALSLINPPSSLPTSTAAKLTEEQKIVHVLNRLGFGPRPGDVERVKKIGLKNYIEQQLNPEKIADEAVEKKTAGFDSLKLDGMEIARMEREVQMGNASRRRLQAEMTRQSGAAAPATADAANPAQPDTPPSPAEQVRKAVELYRNATPEQRAQLEAARMARQQVNTTGIQLVTNKIVRAAESEKQLYEVMVDFWSNHFNIDATKVRAAKVTDEQQVIRPHAMGKFRDLLNASANSAAMMLYLDNAQSVAPQAAPQRRPAAGRFALDQITLDQLKQGAQNGRPVAVQMLQRLQERAKAEGVTEEEAFKRLQTAQRPAPRGQGRGLNENYARELMELHTLGVDGGYTQKDVTEVARCLTGWGVRGGRYSGEFEFHPNLHDRGEKTVLGKTIPAGGGIEDGKAVLDMLASHPSTMRYISTKLCRRLVSDDPPKALVDRCVETWKKTDGDIREIVRTIVNSPEFYSTTAVRSKIKSPFEYVVSAVRATGATVQIPGALMNQGSMRPVAGGFNVFAPNGSGQTNARLLAGQIGTLGQPLYNYGFPTGYPEESSKWISSGALIGRINFALSLVNGQISDVDLSGALIHPGSTAPALMNQGSTASTATAALINQGSTNPGSTKASKEKPLAARIDAVAKSLLGSPLSPGTRATLLKQLDGDEKDGARLDATQGDDTKKIAALVLGSPDFQRR